MTNILCIGVGNPYRCDDSVGLWVARHIRDQDLPATTVIETSGEGVALMQVWKNCNQVILVDAVLSGGNPGTIYRLEAHHQPIPSRFFSYSTHDFNVAEAIELARVLHELPPKLVLYGIEGKSFKHGTDLSSSIVEAALEVTRQIIDEILTIIERSPIL